MQLNESASYFELTDLHGNLHKLSDYLGKVVILNFWSAECPHSERTDDYLNTLIQNWDGEVIALAIASNRNESVPLIQETAEARRVPQVLIDSEHVVADLYEALTTPHVFVIDREGILRYCGAVDDVAFRQRKATRFFLQEAVQALLAGAQPPLSETLAYGCAIVREI